MVVKGNDGRVITITDIIDDEITKLSIKHWLQKDGKGPFDVKIVEDIYNQQLFSNDKVLEQRIRILELSHYFENYLWPNFSETQCGFHHVFSILLMLNAKVAEGVQNPFEQLQSSESKFKLLFEKILDIQDQFIIDNNNNNNNNNGRIQILGSKHLIHYLTFFINCFQNLEDKTIRNESLKICSYPIWLNLSTNRFQEELSNLTILPLKKKILLLKKKQPTNADSRYQNFIRNFFDYFVGVVEMLGEQLNSSVKVSEDLNLLLKSLERFLEFIIDLVTLITTRRFFFALLDDYQLIIKLYSSKFYQSLKVKSNVGVDGEVIKKLMNQLIEYSSYQINNFTGEELTRDVVDGRHYNKIQQLQSVVFKEFPEIKDTALLNMSLLENCKSIDQKMEPLSDQRLQELCQKLSLLDGNGRYPISRTYLLNLLKFSISLDFENLKNGDEILGYNQPLYPTETMLWSSLATVLDGYSGDSSSSLPIPKLGLQYLSFQDYLSRQFEFTMLEASFDIKQLVEDSIKRMAPKFSQTDGKTQFQGWSRMSVPLDSFKITNVHKPLIGETKPKFVNAILQFSIDHIIVQNIQVEWQSIKEHDHLFLVALDFSKENTSSYPLGIKSVRGCKVLENMGHSPSNQSKKLQYNLKVELDSNQYQLDSVTDKSLKLYSSFNVLVRVNPKESNFHETLENMVQLNEYKSTLSSQLPTWLSGLFLGYPDPTLYDSNYHEKRLQKQIIQYNDTFLNVDHLQQTFQGTNYQLEGINELQSTEGPFKLTYQQDNKVLVQEYKYPQYVDKSKLNRVRFTPTQIKAIQSGTLEGLTMIVGPPGTGKTDVAVQIISNIYQNAPGQRTLILTHSNQALNQLFEKIQNLSIPERYLLRLGHGNKQLAGLHDFSRSGRIDYILTQRIQKLKIVEYLAQSLNEPTDVGYTCETAIHYFSYSILNKWEKYQSDLEKHPNDNEYLVGNYPFSAYFQGMNVPQYTLTLSKSFSENMEIIQMNWGHIEGLFKELEEYQVFELLKTPSSRFNYLLLKQAKIIAMTCTHAILKRKELLRLGFKFDNVLMEESAQVSDVESFIPLQLQKTEFTQVNRLKRFIMIGDHNQLPPIVKNIALQKYAHFDQSLFTRFIRLQIPFVLLDKQGRCRASLSEIFKWRYKGLMDLEYIQSEPQYKIANPGFLWEYQLVDVTEADGFGQGEIEPFPHFYQNLGEAEYIVSLYQYMRIMGYPSEKITILTTYKGQKQLLLNVFQQKCKDNALFGMPSKITTVDKYQGQQNDYVLLSLVRTKTFGHIRDVRRLIVAMSRARLGLYVFCKRSLFQTCYETISSLSHFLKKSDKLTLIQESYPTNRLLTDTVSKDQILEIQNSFQMKSLVESNLSQD
ncbi:intron-binding protein aquarius like protein [Tieghemostelium lacteum]|uniref:Intron-binding protein aquarius like protein n=1 Tax=Tieghemostelium lacteum TaxID=361077 RepID=A0A151ZER8_TIELA|nr:intron-binding protein aquarius like protein [Tieghemostelium lacteum]|eukprot:KYQ92453.1 intron-binding protein aquarius like protein [Tieghemostelium lacteum]